MIYEVHLGFLPTAIYQQPFSQFYSVFVLLFAGLNCFHFEMNTNRSGVCERPVLEFSSLVPPDFYRA